MQQPTLCQRGAAIFTRAWIKSGLALARAREVILGRLRDTKYGRDYFLQKHRDIVRQLKAGQSIRNTAKIVGKGISTVRPKFRQGHLPAAVYRMSYLSGVFGFLFAEFLRPVTTTGLLLERVEEVLRGHR